jgi:uncharacterized protein YtpQ (UPF0354 family)
MKWWPLAREQTRPAKTASEPSTLDRMVKRECAREEFFLLYSKLLQERLPDHAVEFSSDSSLRVVNREGKESTTYLENLWLKYKSGDEDRSELIEKYARLAMELGADGPAPQKQNVVAMIKDSTYLEIGNTSGKLLTEHLCGDLWIVYAQDQPDRITSLTRDSLAELGATESELRALALENLSRILPPAECHGDGPWYLMTAGTDYVASLLLLNDVWDQVSEMVAGDIVATVPSRDVLMFTGSESTEGIAAIRERSTETCNTAPHAVSETLIVRRNGAWSVFNAN